MTKFFQDRSLKKKRSEIEALFTGEDGANAVFNWFIKNDDRDNNKFENLQIILEELRKAKKDAGAGERGSEGGGAGERKESEESPPAPKNKNDFIVAWVRKKIANSAWRVSYGYDSGTSYVTRESLEPVLKDLRRVTSSLSPDETIAILSQVEIPDYLQYEIMSPFRKEGFDRSKIIRDASTLLPSLSQKNRFFFVQEILGDENLDQAKMVEILNLMESRADRYDFINCRLGSARTENIDFGFFNRICSLANEGTVKIWEDDSSRDMACAVLRRQSAELWLKKNKENNFDLGYLSALLPQDDYNSPHKAQFNTSPLSITWLQQAEENNFDQGFLEKLNSYDNKLYSAWLKKKDNNNDHNLRGIADKFLHADSSHVAGSKLLRIVESYLSNQDDKEKGPALVRNAQIFADAEARVRDLAAAEHRVSDSHDSPDKAADFLEDCVILALKSGIRIKPEEMASFIPHLFEFCEARYKEDEKAKVRFIKKAIKYDLIVPMRDRENLEEFITENEESRKALKEYLVEVKDWVKTPAAEKQEGGGGGHGEGGGGGTVTVNPLFLRGAEASSLVGALERSEKKDGRK